MRCLRLARSCAIYMDGGGGGVRSVRTPGHRHALLGWATCWWPSPCTSWIHGASRVVGCSTPTSEERATTIGACDGGAWLVIAQEEAHEAPSAAAGWLRVWMIRLARRLVFGGGTSKPRHFASPVRVPRARTRTRLPPCHHRHPMCVRGPPKQCERPELLLCVALFICMFACSMCANTTSARHLAIFPSWPPSYCC